MQEPLSAAGPGTEALPDERLAARAGPATEMNEASTSNGFCSRGPARSGMPFYALITSFEPCITSFALNSLPAEPVCLLGLQVGTNEYQCGPQKWLQCLC